MAWGRESLVCGNERGVCEDQGLHQRGAEREVQEAVVWPPAIPAQRGQLGYQEEQGRITMNGQTLRIISVLRWTNITCVEKGVGLALQFENYDSGAQDLLLGSSALGVTGFEENLEG